MREAYTLIQAMSKYEKARGRENRNRESCSYGAIFFLSRHFLEKIRMARDKRGLRLRDKCIYIYMCDRIIDIDLI